MEVNTPRTNDETDIGVTPKKKKRNKTSTEPNCKYMI